MRLNVGRCFRMVKYMNEFSYRISVWGNFEINAVDRGVDQWTLRCG